MDIGFHYYKSKEKKDEDDEEANLLALISFLWFLCYMFIL